MNRNTEPTRLVVVERHGVIAESIGTLVRRCAAEVDIVAGSAAVSEIENLLPTARFDVAVLGTSQTIEDCLELVEIFRRADAGVGMVLLQVVIYPETALTLMRLGVNALLDGFAAPSDVVSAIAAARAGQTYCNQNLSRDLRRSAIPPAGQFTRRELEVLAVLAQGFSNRDIAESLGIAEKTVEMHLCHIYEKLNVRSRTQAILRALDLHVIAAEGSPEGPAATSISKRSAGSAERRHVALGTWL